MEEVSSKIGSDRPRNRNIQVRVSKKESLRTSLDHSYILGGLDEKKLKVKMKIPYDNFDF